MKGEQQKEAWYRWGTFNEFRFNTEAADRVWLMLLLVPTPRPLQGSEHQPSFRLCSSIRQLIHPQETRGRVFSAMPSPLTPHHAKGHLLRTGPDGLRHTWCCQNRGPGVQTTGQ